MSQQEKKTETFKVYSFAKFDRSGKVKWLLSELGIDYESHVLSSEKKENEGPNFLKRNPMGRVPVLEFGGHNIFESGAICAYIADLDLEKGLAPKLDASERALYQQWMYFASATLDVFQIRIMIIEDIPPGDVLNSKLKVLQDDYRDALLALDKTLEKSKFLVGQTFTAADICVAYHLFWLPMWPELKPIFKEFPRVLDYVERMKGRPKATEVGVFDYEG